MKYCIVCLFFLLSCGSARQQAVLTAAETKLLDSLQFDKAVVADVKAIANVPFQVMKVENQAGAAIPGHLMPAMIYFKAAKTVNLGPLKDMQERYSRMGYNIYALDQQDQKITLIISKL